MLQNYSQDLLYLAIQNLSKKLGNYKKFILKNRFLFDLYDFNELNSLSRVDIEFMLIAV